MTELPLISIIVPVFNAEETLAHCINCLIEQTYTKYELILVNDGSTDTSGRICDEYAQRDSRIRVFHKENGGVSSARNMALEHAHGSYVTFCDSDDYTEEEWLRVYTDAMLADTDFAVQGYTCIDAQGQVTHKKLRNQIYSGTLANRQLTEELIINRSFGYLWVKLFKMQIIKEKNIRFDIHSHFREDEQFVAEFMEYAKSCREIDACNYNYIQPSGNKKYKGNHYYSLPFIFQSLDKIYDKMIPQSICELHYVNIKDYAVISILSGKIPDNYMLDLLQRMAEITGKSKQMSNRLLLFLIYNSSRHPQLSQYTIRLLRSLKKWLS